MIWMIPESHGDDLDSYIMNNVVRNSPDYSEFTLRRKIQHFVGEGLVIAYNLTIR